MTLSLKRVFQLVILSIVVLTIGLCSALSVLTHFLHEATETLANVSESINATKSMKISVLTYSREKRQWEITGDPVHLRLQDAAKEDFAHWLKVFREERQSAEELRLVGLAEETADKYFSVRNLTSASHPQPEKGIAAPGDQVLDYLEQVTAINQLQAVSAKQHSANYNRWADITAVVTIVVVFLAISFFVFFLRRMLFHPISAVAKSVGAFKEGKSRPPIATGATEIIEISDAVSEATSLLLRQRQTQVQYLAAVAHDLRNPLSAIKASSELLLDSEIDSDVAEFLTIIRRQTNHLNSQIEDLLDVTRIEAGNVALRMSAIDLNSTVRESCELFKTYSKLHQLNMIVPEHAVTCRADPARISQVITNLISNAIKYSPFGGDIEVSLSHESEHAIIAVKDSGIGISDEDLPHIFEPFKRSKATRATFPGVGLGLATSRKIVEAHRGRIEVCNTQSKGTTFRVVLPGGADVHP